MPRLTDDREDRFNEYITRLSTKIGHVDRHEPLRGYLIGLCLPGDRKSIEPMAARIDPYHVQALHQSMHHLVANAPWDDAKILREARNQVLGQMERHGSIAAWIVDDTAFPKKGNHSVGVARQYCGVLGKQENCQVSVSLSVANEAVSVPVAYRLYLPEEWTEDRMRCWNAGVPKVVTFIPKWRISLEQIMQLRNEGVQEAPIIADMGYGRVTEYRDHLTSLGIPYVLGVRNDTSVWPPGKGPLGPIRYCGQRRRPVRLRRDKKHRPISVLSLAKQLPKDAWNDQTWREGTKGIMKSRFAAVRVRAAHRDFKLHAPRSVEWLLIEWPIGEKEPTKFWLSTMPDDISLEQLVRLAMIRWRIERDYLEMKSEFGLDHYEGRSWRGFHHHGTLCIAAYAFIAAERARFSPSETLSFLKAARIPSGFKPRGSPCAT